ncbi:hemolysin III family protein [Marinilabiliaceae bacterium JC017]|nr:hemolysin III family protein [Marinilabiliaceae bacterium JC017]
MSIGVIAISDYHLKSIDLLQSRIRIKCILLQSVKQPLITNTLKSKPLTYYSPLEERLNVWSHGIGFLLSLIAFFALLHKGITSGTGLTLISYLVYGASLLILFGASTIYHYTQDPVKRRKLNILDHAAIYLLIAGTYTPFSLVTLNGTWGWWFFGIIWTMGLTGIALKLFFTGRFKLISTLSYLIMGWVAIVAIKPLMDAFDVAPLFWLFAGGAMYTLGAILYQIKTINLNHAIFHFFVLLGAICHFITIFFYVG